MVRQRNDEYSFSAHAEGMRFDWESYTRSEVEAMAGEFGDPEDAPARNVDPRIPRLLATLLGGYAPESNPRSGSSDQGPL